MFRRHPAGRLLLWASLFFAWGTQGLVAESASPAETQLSRILSGIYAAKSIEFQYMVKRPQTHEYQTVHEFRELTGSRRVRRESASYSDRSIVPAQLIVNIENEMGVFLVRPDAKVAIKDPLRSARSTTDPMATLLGGFWYYLAPANDQTTKSSMSTTSPLSDEPAWEIIRTLNRRDAAATGSKPIPAYLRYVIAQHSDRLLAFGTYDKTGTQIEHYDFDLFAINRDLADALFEPPADYRYQFPKTPGEFAQYLVASSPIAIRAESLLRQIKKPKRTK